MEKEKNNPIDIYAIIKFIRNNYKRMVQSGGICMIISAIFLYSIPREYVSTIVLAPEYASSNSISGSLGNIASMVGLNIGNGGGEDALYPEIYPDIISSTQFQTSLFDIKVQSADQSIKCNIFDYYSLHQKRTWWSYAISAVKKIFKKNTSNGKNEATAPNPKWLTEKELAVCESLEGSINFLVDKKTNIITLTYSAQDPLVATTMADSVMGKLQDFIINYRTKKVKIDLEYLTKILKESKQNYETAQANYAKYCDSHIAIQRQQEQSERDRLERELEICATNYTQLCQQIQYVQGKIQERTPSFTVIKNATMPEKPTKPKRLIPMIIFFILGAIAYGTYKYTKDSIFRNNIPA